MGAGVDTRVPFAAEAAALVAGYGSFGHQFFFDFFLLTSDQIQAEIEVGVAQGYGCGHAGRDSMKLPVAAGIAYSTVLPAS
ncbi:hypothetical protein [Bythopirellula polymerisocia]|uniref:Uncharacterized protein n=1 Tax=Bythopirellula polymerisocia TaxID=2528003 RepID=A0A5C6CTE5_9BACT|nr:hypothetical protein [Bythopirellula polymerisocia]TWU28213.1 hypothetical protein Pla144_15000 [Bythopirellula polymerisocia]